MKNSVVVQVRRGPHRGSQEYAEAPDPLAAEVSRAFERLSALEALVERTAANGSEVLKIANGRLEVLDRGVATVRDRLNDLEPNVRRATAIDKDHERLVERVESLENELQGTQARLRAWETLMSEVGYEQEHNPFAPAEVHEVYSAVRRALSQLTYKVDQTTCGALQIIMTLVPKTTLNDDGSVSLTGGADPTKKIPQDLGGSVNG